MTDRPGVRDQQQAAEVRCEVLIAPATLCGELVADVAEADRCWEHHARLLESILAAARADEAVTCNYCGAAEDCEHDDMADQQSTGGY